MIEVGPGPGGLTRALLEAGADPLIAIEKDARARFDDLVTAPLHGFRNTDDYWTRASSKPVLGHITVPTLMINARNDPFLPEYALPHPRDVSPSVTLEFPDGGGHAGFMTGPFPGRLDWLPRRVLAFFRTPAVR